MRFDVNVAGTTVPLLRFLSLSLSQTHTRARGVAPRAGTGSSCEPPVHYLGRGKSSPIKSIQKQQSTKRKPLECALEAISGGREMGGDTCNGGVPLSRGVRRFDLTCLDIGREESDV